MNFDIPPDLVALRDRTRRFIAEQVIPLKATRGMAPMAPPKALREELVACARAAGLLTPHTSKKMGGPGLSHIAKAMLCEKAGDSNLGPTAPNIYAPSEGNIHLMKVVATSAQKERWLRPQVAGQTRSCFAMTEPAPGAGADCATGMARIENGTATMFLTDMDQPGICSERSRDAMDNCIIGGHGVLRFDNLRTPAHQVLGEVGQGF